ncbi:DNA-binding transcriptional LysR family regulator [Saccharothrix ecbatanensis]|uniref:DNA-binding transcriptional LysR family regulator n=1 Tax=Saccharothrix ecbatanensis TaxID=1105145 RepID=A0A7W9LZ01_9PSEU|nr:LysR family transcriptional regulator [Saccharothrix ecbatanensis]MBB5801404.1 DNA-binding transcriptional LysR family regulator [Saccharothrix ecbatanensis]
MSANWYDLSIHQLRTFLEVARTGNLTKAASRLGYAQSSVTVHIRTLERRLGVRLFHRHSQGVRLTDEGESVIGHASRLFEVIDDMVRSVGSSEPVRGRVAIGGPAVLTSYYLGPLLRKCHQVYPELRLSTRTLRPSDIEKTVRAGEVDLGFVLTEDCGDDQFRDGPLHWRTLCAVDFVAVSTTKTGVRVDDVVLVDDPECVAQQVMAREFRRRFGRPLPSLEVGSIASAVDNLRDTTNVAFVPYVAVKEKIDRGELSIVSHFPSAHVHARAIWRAEMTNSPTLTAVVRHAVEVLSDPVAELATVAPTCALATAG